MELLKTLKFVRDAVSNKVANEEMRHFVIANGHVRATNGVMSLGSPIDLDFSCNPHAETLFKAVGNCKDTVSLHMTPAGRLSVRSGNFRALVPCYEDATVHPKPSGAMVEGFNGAALMDAFALLERFVCKDDLRPWTNGILLRDQFAYATNNVCLVQYWLGEQLPFVANIPLPAIKEVLRINENPSVMLMDQSSVTFMYDDGRWLKTLLYETEWPPLDKVLEVPSNPQPIPDTLFDALSAVMPFTGEDRHVHFKDGCVNSSADPSVAGASYAVEGLAAAGIYRAEMLSLLKGCVTTADFNRYPEPVMFFGERFRGAILGSTR